MLMLVQYLKEDIGKQVRNSDSQGHTFESGKSADMIVTTTPLIEGEVIGEYRGLVGGEAILSATVFRPVIGGIFEVPGLQPKDYSQSMESAREQALSRMMRAAGERGANAVVGVHIDCKSICLNENEHSVIVIATGTAVRYVD